MRNCCTWILILILSCDVVWSRPQGESGSATILHQPKDEPQQEQVISVRITSSVAVARGKKHKHSHGHGKHATSSTSLATEASSIITTKLQEDPEKSTIPPTLAGANIEFIKQLNSKKEARGLHNLEGIHTFPSSIANQYFNATDDSVAEPSVKSILELDNKDEETGESIADIPRARSLGLSPSSKNLIQGLTHKPLGERGNSPRLTTVGFNIMHDAAKVAANYNDPSDTFTPRPSSQPKFYNQPPKFYNEPAKVYSQPAQVYSEPAKYYSEPARIYSEPAKVYSEPAKVYGEPAKIYSEPAKFYSQPASLHLPPVAPMTRDYTPWQPAPSLASSTVSTTPTTTINIPPSTRRNVEHQPEKNYEVDEKISVLTDGRSHGVQESTTESCKQENCKVGYVVEGRQYRKYRVEERTSDGFIVGEYGVVRHEDGALRGVRYTADGDTSPRLIYDALMKFLQLK